MPGRINIPGVVHQHVQPPKLRDHAIEHRIHPSLVRNIGCDSDTADRPGHFRSPARVQTIHHHTRPSLGEPRRHGAPDPMPRPGHQYDLLHKIIHNLLRIC
jgi:hypothetical protein